MHIYFNIRKTPILSKKINMHKILLNMHKMVLLQMVPHTCSVPQMRTYLVIKDLCFMCWRKLWRFSLKYIAGEMMAATDHLDTFPPCGADQWLKFAQWMEPTRVVHSFACLCVFLTAG